jgi:RNA polymerase sigma factor (sigma-70 family)
LGIERFAAADIGRLFRGQSVTGLSEWQLLERYLERQDEVAFEALVARHGPMVLGVCRRVLSSASDIEDAFQATFLVLVRRARQLGPRDAIGPWLHGVAVKVALRARCEAARRRRFESIPVEAAGSRAVAVSAAAVDIELSETLDQELRRLPSKYRSPVVLCYLEGQTHEEAARLLKWPLGTVKGRLARARELLRSRLARRGVGPAALAAFGSLRTEASECVPRELLETTVRLGLKYAIGETTTQLTSTSIASLVEGALTAMFFTKIQWFSAALLISPLALAGAGVMAQQHSKSFEGNLAAFAAKAELQGAQGGGGFGGEIHKAKRLVTAVATRGHGKDPRSQVILTKLDDSIAVNFPNETTLDEFLKHIKEATKSTEMPRGIPIYVDPIGLQEAEKSINSTITIDLDGVPLKRTLQLVLKQIGLGYFVEDGMIYITSEDSLHETSHFRPAVPEESPLMEEGERALRGDLTVQEMKEWLEKYKLCLKIKGAFEPGDHDGDPSEINPPAINEEVKKLTATNDEIKKKLEKLESQMSELRQLLSELARKEKPEQGTKPGRNIQ